MEKKEKIKKEKAPKASKKSKMPEGYIGRPKPMKTKSFEFHKPTVGNWIAIGLFAAFIIFATYIVLRLIDVSKIKDNPFEFYGIEEEKSKEYVLENDKVRFELDAATTNITLIQKDTGKVWKSCPDGVDEDTLSLAKEKNYMKSPLLIKYSTENGVDNVYDTKSYSVDKNFYSIEKSNNEITVNYTVGQIEREYQYPLAIYEKDMKAYLKKMSKNDQNVITKRCYRLVDIKKLKADDNKGELLEKYPQLADEKLYLIFDPLAAYLKVQCEEIFDSIGFTYDEYIEYKELYKEKSEKEVPAFNVSISYKIDGNKLIVDVPFDKISYKHTYPIVQLSVLPYFGAANSTDKGFIFIPEGGGSLINFNNGKIKQNGYVADVYGWDYAQERKAVITETRAAFPVFGEAYEDSSFISIIKNGAPYASISADIAGRLSNFNYVRAEFKMIHGEQFEVSARTVSAQYAYEESLPKGESITQVYSFIPSASYVDMAKEYQNYLFAGEAKLKNNNSPLAIEVIGAIDKIQQVAGMPKSLPYKLTTYDETAQIINEIEELGIKDVNYKLTGFINDGVSQKLLSKVKFIKVLGGKKHFAKMLEAVKNTSAKLYLDGSVQFAHRPKMSDGFNRFTTPARQVSSELCKLYKYSPIWYGKQDWEDPYYYINPTVSAKASDVFAEVGSKYNLAGLSYSDNGYILSGDYNDKHPASRSAVRDLHVQKMAEAKSKNLNVMINAGNDYALKNADFITNMSLRGNNYSIIDAQVPFYQIALHGYRNFTGSAVNLGYEKNQVLLESAESGAGLYFTVMAENEMALQETTYTEYYAAHFEKWKPQINEIYSRYNKEIGVVANSCITDHEFLNDFVTVTTFDNGYKIYVNFGYVDYVTEGGVSISARNYKVLQEVK